MTYKSNSYEDDDMRSVIDQIETYEAQKAKIMASAMGECAGLSSKIKDVKKQAKDELGIPLKVLNPLLKRRKLEKKIADLSDGVDEDYVEVFEDAVGQFCLFALIEDEDQPEEAEGEEPSEVSPDPTDAEQAEGEAVLGQVRH